MQERKEKGMLDESGAPVYPLISGKRCCLLNDAIPGFRVCPVHDPDYPDFPEFLRI
jgi:hypothetical protein